MIHCRTLYRRAPCLGVRATSPTGGRSPAGHARQTQEDGLSERDLYDCPAKGAGEGARLHARYPSRLHERGERLARACGRTNIECTMRSPDSAIISRGWPPTKRPLAGR